MAGNTESRLGLLAGVVACVLILALTLMAMAPRGAPSMFQPLAFKPISTEAPMPELPLPTGTPSFAFERAV